MRRRSFKNILFIVIALVLIVSTGGYLVWNKPHTDVKEASAIETNAVALYNIFINDSAKAKSTYVNNVVNVSGIIKQVSFNQEKQQIVLLKTSEVDASVNCTMEVNAKEFKVGDSVMIKGICVGYMGGDADMGLPGDVFLIRCYTSAKT